MTLAIGLMDMMLRNVTMTARRGRPVILLNNAGKMVAFINAVSGIFFCMNKGRTSII